MNDATRAVAIAVGALVRQRRMSRGMQQQELAAKLGVSPALVCLIEKGKRDVTLETLKRIAVALDCTFRLTMHPAENSTEVVIHV